VTDAAATRHVAFLRAINVGGRTVKMDRLRAELTSLGLANVATYIASGNALFDAPPADALAVEARITHHVAGAFGFETETFVRTATELAAVAAHAAELDPGGGVMVYVGFLHAEPDPDARQKVAALQTPIDRLHLRGTELYWLCDKTISQSDLTGAQIEKTLGMPTTLRNLNTVRTLAARMAELQRDPR
jgi:uncharacterized protein (DUF1697 family)